MEDLTAHFIVWWRINVSGRLQLGAFLRFVMTETMTDTNLGENP